MNNTALWAVAIAALALASVSVGAHVYAWLVTAPARKIYKDWKDYNGG